MDGKGIEDRIFVNVLGVPATCSGSVLKSRRSWEGSICEELEEDTEGQLRLRPRPKPAPAVVPTLLELFILAPDSARDRPLLAASSFNIVTCTPLDCVSMISVCTPLVLYSFFPLP